MIVFLHGFLGTSEDWQEVWRELPDATCVGIDLPGHGKSPFSEKFEIGIEEPFHLVGYSMGGRLAMQFAEKNRERVKTLTLVSTHPGLKTEEEREKRVESDQRWADLLLKEPIDEFLKRWYDQPLFGNFKPMRKKQDPKNLAKALIHYSLAHQSCEAPENAMFVVGERDEKFRKLTPNAEVIQDAAHAVHLENPKALAGLIHRRIFS
ncbi:MAG: hypothetical protein A3E80_03940 [Chlamydiae bacterium RIFCSPHIGHO2_12_FULL_49_9]|nr:MAG: hypothetical protein A3E80_03940 [Chlamydiae bacterium RIFCSPHIGHO2_12_FULL_49_9]